MSLPNLKVISFQITELQGVVDPPGFDRFQKARAYAAIIFCHNHYSPAHHRDLHRKFAPTPVLLDPDFCPGTGDLWGSGSH